MQWLAGWFSVWRSGLLTSESWVIMISAKILLPCGSGRWGGGGGLLIPCSNWTELFYFIFTCQKLSRVFVRSLTVKMYPQYWTIVLQDMWSNCSFKLTQLPDNLFLHTRQGFLPFSLVYEIPVLHEGYKTTLIMWLNTCAPLSKDIGQRQDKICWYRSAHC